MPFLPMITLALAPWRGPSLPTVSPGAVKYKLTIRGPAERAVQVHATGLPHGWVASFCTRTICSPFSYNIQLNDRGIGVVEFQAIRTQDDAPEHAAVLVTAQGAHPLKLRI